MPTCTVTWRSFGHTTSAASLFEAARNALEWWEVDCREFGTQKQIADDDVLEVRLAGGVEYRVKAGKVRTNHRVGVEL